MQVDACCDVRAFVSRQPARKSQRANFHPSNTNQTNSTTFVCLFSPLLPPHCCWRCELHRLHTVTALRRFQLTLLTATE